MIAGAALAALALSGFGSHASKGRVIDPTDLASVFLVPHVQVSQKPRHNQLKLTRLDIVGVRKREPSLKAISNRVGFVILAKNVFILNRPFLKVANLTTFPMNPYSYVTVDQPRWCLAKILESNVNVRCSVAWRVVGLERIELFGSRERSTHIFLNHDAVDIGTLQHLSMTRSLLGGSRTGPGRAGGGDIGRNRPAIIPPLALGGPPKPVCGNPEYAGEYGHGYASKGRHNPRMSVSKIEDPQTSGRYSVPVGTLIWGAIFALAAYLGKVWAEHRYGKVIERERPHHDGDGG